MLGEPPGLSERRKELNSTVRKFRSALEVIQRDKDVNPF